MSETNNASDNKILVLSLDSDDFDTIQDEIKLRLDRDINGSEFPEGTSCDAGALLAEAIRDLNEYRDKYGVDHLE